MTTSKNRTEWAIPNTHLVAITVYTVWIASNSCACDIIAVHIRMKYVYIMMGATFFPFRNGYFLCAGVGNTHNKLVGWEMGASGSHIIIIAVMQFWNGIQLNNWY